MANTSLPRNISDELLAHLGDCDAIEGFLARALPLAQDALPAASLAVVRSTPPHWLVVAVAGISPNHVPTDLAAEALDQETMAKQGEWVAMPLTAQYAVLLKAELAEETLSHFQAVLARAFAAVQEKQQGVRRIRRLEKILEITHAWGQTSCMEALLQAMAEAATELLAADRASARRGPSRTSSNP